MGGHAYGQGVVGYTADRRVPHVDVSGAEGHRPASMIEEGPGTRARRGPGPQFQPRNPSMTEGLACIVIMAFVVMACVVMACVVVAYTGMAYIVMVYIVMA